MEAVYLPKIFVAHLKLAERRSLFEYWNWNIFEWLGWRWYCAGPGVWFLRLSNLLLLETATPRLVSGSLASYALGGGASLFLSLKRITLTNKMIRYKNMI